MSDEMDLGLPEETTTGAANAPQTPYAVSDVLGDEATRKAITEYIASEIIDVRDGSDRDGLTKRWERWRRIRRARPESETRSSPWKDSANVMPPLAAQKVNTIFAKELSAFTAKKPPVTVMALNPSDRELAESLMRLFKGLADSPNGLNMGKNLQTFLYEQVSLGTQFVKVPFLIDQWAFKRTSDAGTEQVTYVRHQGPAAQAIKLEDFFTRPYWKDIQRAPWVAVRYRYYKHELQQQAAMGAFDPEMVEKIYGVALTEYDDNLLSSLEASGVGVGTLGAQEPNKEYEIYECYVYWDADGDGIPEDIKLWIEPDTGTILRSEFNPLSIRDIVPVIYFDDPDVLYGVGVCEMVDSLQEEVSTLHNMRIDGTHLAMLKLWFARRGAGITDEEFSPFKVMELDDPRNDINPVDFPDVAPSCLQGEMVAREYADKVTGASDYMAGFNDNIVKSGASVGGTMFLAQQSNSILNGILQNAEQAISRIYEIAFYQCIANKDKLDLSFLSIEDQSNIASIFAMKVEELPTKFKFIVKATDISQTDEAKKQNFMAMSQLYAVYGEKALQMSQMMMQAQDPLQKELVMKLIIGSREFMGKMIEFFDIGNPDDFLPYVEHLKVQMQAMDKVREQQTLMQKEALRNGAGIGPQSAGAPAGQAVLGGGGLGQGAPGAGVGGTAGPAGVPGGSPAAGGGNQPGASGGFGSV